MVTEAFLNVGVPGVLLLTKPGSVTRLLDPLFTEVFMDPEELLDRCRMDLSASEGEKTISGSSSAEAILDSFSSHNSPRKIHAVFLIQA